MLYFQTALDGLQYGLCYAILAMGLYISYTILDFADLGVDGVFPLGGVIGTIVLYNFGLPPILAILIAGIAGALAGGVTGFLHVKLKISGLLCGIIVMTGMISITMALTLVLSKNGYPLTLFPYNSHKVQGLFNAPYMKGLSLAEKKYVKIAIMLAFVVVVKIVMDLFLKTKVGFMLRATGNNSQMVTSLGKDPGNYKIMGLMIADFLTGVSGCLFAQLQNTYDDTSGSGKVVIALVAVILGISLFSGVRFMKGTTAVCIGAVIYSLALNFFVLVDEKGIYLKLFNAIFFVLVLVLSRKFKDFRFTGIKALFKDRKKGVK